MTRSLKNMRNVRIYNMGSRLLDLAGRLADPELENLPQAAGIRLSWLTSIGCYFKLAHVLFKRT